jgi:membrane-associated protease RseP (regulator of RpoE activity)
MSAGQSLSQVPMSNGFQRIPGPWPAIEDLPNSYSFGKQRGRFRYYLGRVWGSVYFSFLLFLLTIFTTLVVGVHLAANYSQHLPLFDLNISWAFFAGIFQHPGGLWAGAPYAFTLVLILLAHEMGHYLTCRHYGIDATYPYFFPAPTLIGTFGAFIRIKSPVATREELFDVGIAGPIAGFVITVPALVIGVWHSTAMLMPVPSDTILLGHPWAVQVLTYLLHPRMPVARLELSPVGCAAWVGLFLTALNLLPMGQLDGGHIVYSVFGKKHRYVSFAMFLALVPLGIFFWGGWLLWAGLMLILGLRHPAPLITPDQPLDRRRKALAALALMIFILCFTISPFLS